jgi:hypothetical protein
MSKRDLLLGLLEVESSAALSYRSISVNTVRCSERRSSRSLLLMY